MVSLGSTNTTTTSSTSPSLLAHLLRTLEKEARGRRDFAVSILRSTPRRCYSLFPWASDASAKVYQEHILVVLAEKAPAAPRADTDATEQDATAPHLPILGLELAIYTIPSTSTALLYVSKVDTTGLLPTPAPSRLLTTSIIQYYIQNHPHNVASLRTHVFARAQDQYLFPGSIENKGKRVLDDKGLCKWWRSVLGDAAARAHSYDKSSNDGQAKSSVRSDIQMFYLLAGCSYLESLPLLSAATDPAEPDAPRWKYGHPYSAMALPVPIPEGKQPTLNDLIPAFQDDPKSRYLTSLTSTPVPPAGDEGDYDDIMNQLHKLSETSSTLHGLRRSEMDRQIEQERRRLLKMNVDDYWECMGGRQECCAGHVAGFFVVASDRRNFSKQGERASPESDAAPQDASSANLGRVSEDSTDVLPIASNHAHAPTPAKAALPHASYVKLWSAIHNVDYSSQTKSTEAFSKWIADLKHAVQRHAQDHDGHIGDEVFGQVAVDRPFDPTATSSASISSGLKRSDAPATVTTLQVKKKKKVAPA